MPWPTGCWAGLCGPPGRSKRERRPSDISGFLEVGTPFGPIAKPGHSIGRPGRFATGGHRPSRSVVALVAGGARTEPSHQHRVLGRLSPGGVHPPMSHPALNPPRVISLLLCLAAGCATVRPESSPQFKTYASVGDRPYPIVSSDGDGDAVASGQVEPERRGREPGVIAGRVVDSRGKPIAGVQVRLASDGAGRGRVNTSETDQAGGFTLRGLRPGTSYTLIAEYEDGNEVFTRRIEAEAPDERVRITLGGDEGEVPTYARSPRPSISRASNVRKGPPMGGPEVALDSRLRINPADIDPPPASEAETLDGPDPSLDPPATDPPSASTRKGRMVGAWRPSGSSIVGEEPGDETPIAVPDRYTGRGRPGSLASSPRAEAVNEPDEPLPPAIERPMLGQGAVPIFTEADAASLRPVRPPSAPSLNAPGARPRREPEPIGEVPLPGRDARPQAIEEPSRPIHRAPPVLDFSDRTPRIASSAPEAETQNNPTIPESSPPTRADEPGPGAGRAGPDHPLPDVENALPSAEVPGSTPAPEPSPTPLPEVPQGLPSSDPIPAMEPSADSAPPELPETDSPPSQPTPEPGASTTESDSQVEQTAEFSREGGRAETEPQRRIRWGQLVAHERARAGAPGAIEPEARRTSAILPGTKLKRAGAKDSQVSAAPEESSPIPRRGEVVCKLDASGKRITAMQAPDILGRDVRLEDLDSDLILLDFWGTWCSPCRDAIPHLVELQKTHGVKKLRVLGIAYEQAPIDRRASVVAETGRKLGVNYPLLLGLSDTPCPIRDALRIQVYPTMILLDRHGRILWRQEGATQQNLARLDRAVAIALQECAAAESVRR
ncbi:MAG: carboxypeptidase regulatory-like domain-containing protein [Isosphaeraceae bacterium]